MIPHVPDDAPFSIEQRSWLNGYLAGLFSVQQVDLPATELPADARPADPITVLYGSQTGTAEGLARQTAARLAKTGYAVEIAALDECAPSDLVAVERLLVITSTYGDGEMPDNAQLFWDALTSADAPSLSETAFGVLGLGDSSYPEFCQAGRDLDERLRQLGARALHERVDCDVDFEAPFESWLETILTALRGARSLARAA